MRRLMLLALWAANVAWAAVPVSLPPGEVLAYWRAAFELADLTPAATRSTASVRIRLVGSRWAIVAVAPDGRERSETVPPPQSPIEREEVALLAQSLIRDLGLVQAPDPWRELLPPPPPPPPPPRAPVEAPAPRVTPVPAPDPIVIVVEPRPRKPPELVVVEPTWTTAIEAAPLEFPRRRRAIALPGVAFGPVLELRPGIQPAAGFELGVHPGQWGRWSAEVTLRGLAAAEVELGYIATRQLVQFGARGALGYDVIDRLTVQAGVGTTMIQFRQQHNDVTSVFVPLATVGTAVALVRWRGLSLDARVHGTADLSVIRLYDELGSRRTLSPLTGILGVVLKTPTLGDPKSTSATSRK